MANGGNPPMRSRKPLKLSSIHAGRRTYPKARPADLQLPSFSSEESIADRFTPSSPDILPEHTSPTSPKFHRRHNSLGSFSSQLLARSGIRMPTSRAFWVVLWFFLNFSLTLCNKIVLNRFPFPYSITAFHALGGCLGTWFTIRYEDRLPTLSRGEIAVLLSFSVLYTLNIVVSNVSLQLVTVPFHQVVRSSSPFFTLVLSFLLLNSHINRPKLTSLIPVVAGVGLATYGDYYYTLPGFLLTLFGTFLASLKTVVTNVLQSPYAPTPPLIHQENTHSNSQRPQVRSSKGQERSSSISITVTFAPNDDRKNSSSHPSRLYPLSVFSSIPKLHLTPVQLLHLLSPLALFQCTLLALYFGELDKIIAQFQLHHLIRLGPTTTSSLNLGNDSSTLYASTLNGSGVGVGAGLAAGADAHNGHVLGSIMPGVLGLAINASMAFALNIVSFHTNRKVGALGMSVAANVKQVLTILTSVVLFNLRITGMNTAGILLTLLGGAWYARVDLREGGRNPGRYI